MLINLLWFGSCFVFTQELISGKNMKNQLKVVCGVLAMALAGQVSAATTWTLGSSYGTISGGVTVSALSNTGGSDTVASSANNAATQTIQAANWVNTWGGIGNADACSSGSYCDTVEGTSPEHSIDNNQRYDMALLSFSSSVKLTQMKLGWSQTDSDVTVMAYTGTGAPTALVGQKYGDLLSAGWSLIGNYADIGTVTKTINAASVFSSYWLVGAYNPLAGGATSGLDVGNDYVKLASVTGCVSGSTGCNPPTTGKVPEPGSLALMGVGILGLIRMRKSRKS